MHKLFDEMMKASAAARPTTHGPAPLMAAHADPRTWAGRCYKMAEKTPEEVVCEMYENESSGPSMLLLLPLGLDYSQSGVGFMLAIYMDRLPTTTWWPAAPTASPMPS